MEWHHFAPHNQLMDLGLEIKGLLIFLKKHTGLDVPPDQRAHITFQVVLPTGET